MLSKSDILRHVGSMEQLASVRRVTCNDGHGDGLRLIELRNGCLDAAFVADRCLDPAWIRWKGIHFTFLTKPGLASRHDCDYSGNRTIIGGGMFTCGFDNIHGHRMVDGVQYPTHGTIRTTPAEKISTDAFWDGDKYRLTIAGEMRESALFGENLVLRRQITSSYEDNGFVLADTVSNEGFYETPLCLLYHCNFGFPLLQEGSRLILPSLECIPRDADAEAGMERRGVMDTPADQAKEQVFQHRMASDAQGETFAALVNDKLGIGMAIYWNVSVLPYMTQWKSFASGDYAMAVEPTNTGFEGRAKPGDTLLPMQEKSFQLRFVVLEDGNSIRQMEKAARSLINSAMI